MMETIKEQTYKNIVTIIYSDDPRDDYVTGDIIIKGTIYEKSLGDATYNLYCNDLLRNIPNEDGWIYFLDDDDELTTPDAIGRIIKKCDRNAVNAFKVSRNNGKIVPEKWQSQRSFQTECFIIHTDHKLKASWWSHKGGDHHFTKQLTKVLPINWIDGDIVCKAQTGKGYGKKLDKDGKVFDGNGTFTEKSYVNVMAMSPVRTDYYIQQGSKTILPFVKAIELEKLGKVKLTHAEYITIKKDGSNGH